MSAVTKQSSIPVATLAITLLTATLPAQCEELSTLKPDSVHVWRQTVLHTSSGSFRWYQSDEMWLYQLRVSVQFCYVYGGNSESVFASITYFIFWGTPSWLSTLRKGLPQTAGPKLRPPGTPLTVRWPGAYCVTTAGISRTSCHFCSAPLGLIMHVCLDRQTGCDDERRIKGKWWGEFCEHVDQSVDHF